MAGPWRWCSTCCFTEEMEYSKPHPVCRWLCWPRHRSLNKCCHRNALAAFNTSRWNMLDTLLHSGSPSHKYPLLLLKTTTQGAHYRVNKNNKEKNLTENLQFRHNLNHSPHVNVNPNNNYIGGIVYCGYHTLTIWHIRYRLRHSQTPIDTREQI